MGPAILRSHRDKVARSSYPLNHPAPIALLVEAISMVRLLPLAAASIAFGLSALERNHPWKFTTRSIHSSVEIPGCSNTVCRFSGITTRLMCGFGGPFNPVTARSHGDPVDLGRPPVQACGGWRITQCSPPVFTTPNRLLNSCQCAVVVPAWLAEKERWAAFCRAILSARIRARL